jgi:hypothetical protein
MTTAKVSHYHAVHGGSVRIGINLPTLADAHAIVDAMAGTTSPIVEVWAITADGAFQPVVL